MEALIVMALCGAVMALIGFIALAIDRRQQRRRHSQSK